MEEINSAPPSRDPQPSHLWREVLLGNLVGVSFWVGGYLLLRGDQRQFGVTMFWLMPFVAGFAIALVVRNATLLTACCVNSGLLSLLILVLTGLEGHICCLMAFPILAVGMFIGALVGRAVRRACLDRKNHNGTITVLILVGLPFLLAAADQIEKPWRCVARSEIFATTVFIKATPETVWDLLANMRTMEGRQPLLLWAGLPVPQRCVLEEAAVGGRRVCYFDQGLIAQQVTEWRQPDRMTVRVVESTLPGRHWLTYVNAGYDLTALDSGTLLVRRTMIASRLYPRWYWSYFEQWGVTSEHEYVLANIKRWAEEKQGGK
jgi:hypothetical protein